MDRTENGGGLIYSVPCTWIDASRLRISGATTPFLLSAFTACAGTTPSVSLLPHKFEATASRTQIRDCTGWALIFCYS